MRDMNVVQSVFLEEVMGGGEWALSHSVTSTGLVSSEHNWFSSHMKAGFHHVCIMDHNQLSHIEANCSSQSFSCKSAWD